MNDFKTIEGATELFRQHNALDQQNCIFVATQDTQHSQGGLVGGMQMAEGVFGGDFKGILINATERGLHMISLKGRGGVMTRIKADNLEAAPELYEFLSYEAIGQLTVKNFNFLNKKTQRVYINYNAGHELNLLANVTEPNIPYHEQNFASFVAKYKK